MSAAAPTLSNDVKVISFVSAAHWLSHFLQLVLPPLFPLIKNEFGVSYVALGAVTAVFYAFSGVAQTAAGFLVDRLGARTVLLAGMVLFSTGVAMLGMAPSFAWLFAGAVVAGLGNSVFHPADFALLNAKVTERRLGYAFSVHGIAGNLGWTLAPLFALALAGAYGWRGALVGAGVLGLGLTACVAMQPVLASGPIPVARQVAATQGGWREDVRLLTSTAILLCFGFFLLQAMTLIGFQTFAIPSLETLYGVAQVLSTTALTGFLLGGAFGILGGGVIAARTTRHGVVAASGMFIGALGALLLGSGRLPHALLVPMMSLTGFALGAVGPSRDILVRRIAPEHARGKVYGFVYSGLDLGGLVAPLMFGLALDSGHPAWMFAGAAVLMIASIPTVLQLRRRPAPQAA